jgi:hypothetical protein
MNVSQPKVRSLAGPLILITVGLLFLIQNLTDLNIFRIVKQLWPYWPLVLVVLGVLKLLEYFRGSSPVR